MLTVDKTTISKLNGSPGANKEIRILNGLIVLTCAFHAPLSVFSLVLLPIHKLPNLPGKSEFEGKRKENRERRENARFLFHDSVRVGVGGRGTFRFHPQRERSFSRRRRWHWLASHHRRLSQSQCLWQAKELLPRFGHRDRYLIFPFIINSLSLFPFSSRLMFSESRTC